MKRKKHKLKIKVKQIAQCHCFAKLKRSIKDKYRLKGVRFLDINGIELEEIFGIIAKPKIFKGAFKKQFYQVNFCPLCGKRYQYGAYKMPDIKDEKQGR